MTGLVLAAALLFSDPVGDVPPAGYSWPRAAIYQEVGFADLVAFRVEPAGEGTRVAFQLDRTPRGEGAPLGFSLAVLAVYLDHRPGGVEVLPGAGFAVPRRYAADYAVLVSGWEAVGFELPGGERVGLPARREGEWVVVDLPLPYRGGRTRYYPLSGVYDPFEPTWFRAASPEGGIWKLKAPPGSPAAVDVFDPEAYGTGVLYPASTGGGVDPRRVVALALALASGLMLGWAGVGVVKRWRRR